MKHGRQAGGLALIIVGAIFLLNSLGIVNWSLWWFLVRLWPLLLVGIGLELVFRRPFLVWSMVVIILGGLGWYYLSGGPKNIGKYYFPESHSLQKADNSLSIAGQRADAVEAAALVLDLKDARLVMI